MLKNYSDQLSDSLLETKIKEKMLKKYSKRLTPSFTNHSYTADSVGNKDFDYKLSGNDYPASSYDVQASGMREDSEVTPDSSAFSSAERVTVPTQFYPIIKSTIPEIKKIARKKWRKFEDERS